MVFIRVVFASETALTSRSYGKIKFTIAGMLNTSIVERYKVAAYITAYEDPEAVMLCFQAINSQSFTVQKIFIVDNSYNKSILSFGLNYNKVIVKYHPENIGVSGGLKLAVEWAIEQGYDFLWAFDQDSVVQKDCLSKILYAYKNINTSKYLIGIVAPIAIDTRSNQLIEGAVFAHDHFTPRKPPSLEQPYECDSPITSGSLISITAAKTIDLPRADLFIDGVDLDYGLRLRHKGFHNLIVPQAIMYHNFGNPIQVKFLQKQLSVQNYSALRHYYICRNHTYLSTRYAQGWYVLTSFMRRIKYMLHTIVLILLYDSEDKTLKIWACLLGTYHGLKGKLGKNWQ